MSTDGEMERRWVAGELSKHPASEFTLWLRRKQSDAWELGYASGVSEGIPNPYRSDEDG